MTGKETVFVGMSGGVDSSVAALRLLREGYNVVGVFIKVWHPEWLKCNWEAERLDAMRVAAHLGIPFLTCDAEAAYKKDVADYFIAEYQAGRTPNPDVMCNRYVKFGRFLEFAHEHGVNKIATGHYARVGETNNQQTLLRGVDTDKDQSYFLWTLTSEQLAHVLFPVGNTPKPEIRNEAAAAGLPTATKQDSQGICFLGHIDIPEFLSHYTDLVEGDVCNTEGKVIGVHKGALVYTLGQRHGFTVSTDIEDGVKHYVVDKDLSKNTITVAHEPPTLETDTRVQLSDIVFRDTLVVGEQCEAQFRYRQQPFLVRVDEVSDSRCTLTPLEVVSTPAVGQSCVLYRGDVCIGGGIIQ